MLTRRRILFLLALTAACALLPPATRPAAAQDNNPPPNVRDVLSSVGQSVGSMFSDLLTPYQSPANPTGAYAGIPQSRGKDGAFILGDPDAPITFIEFSDWACPHCQAYKPVMDQFIDEYVRTGQANFELRMFPTAGGQLSILASRIAECADNQRPGAFWAVSETFYELAETGRYDGTLAPQIIKRFHLDADSLLDCIDTSRQGETDYYFGIEAGIRGTPAVMIRRGDGAPEFITRGGQTYDGGGVPYDVLQFVMEGGSTSTGAAA